MLKKIKLSYSIVLTLIIIIINLIGISYAYDFTSQEYNPYDLNKDGSVDKLDQGLLKDYLIMNGEKRMKKEDLEKLKTVDYYKEINLGLRNELKEVIKENEQLKKKIKELEKEKKESAMDIKK